MKSAYPYKPSNSRGSRQLRHAIVCGLEGLASKTSQLAALDRTFRRALPKPLSDHVQFALLQRRELVFLVTSSTWAARLRLMQRQLLDTARAIHVDACSIKVKIVSKEVIEQPEVPQKRLSNRSASHLQTAAEVTTDPELKDLFLALSKRI